ncbi:MAG: anti-sigma factor antagonist [Candidatus Omnitrophica bacterium]|jgi:anti-anti-sigma factor|nr:anti-sigma factor antagonist [Candidatus Omnitrophota bacterium]
MKVILREKDDVVILDLEGNIDINASNLVETVGEILKRDIKDIVCNLESVNLVDYVGVSLLAVIYKNILNHQGRIVLYSIPSHVMKLFAIVGLDKVFEYYTTEEEALNHIKEERVISQILRTQLRRRFKRIPINLDIEYRQKLTTKNLFYRGKVVNLSAVGIFVVANKIFSPGELLFSRINFLPKPGIIELDAKVIWVAEGEEKFQGLCGMGINFHNITTEKQALIIQFVERHLASPAKD